MRRREETRGRKDVGIKDQHPQRQRMKSQRQRVAETGSEGMAKAGSGQLRKETYWFSEACFVDILHFNSKR